MPYHIAHGIQGCSGYAVVKDDDGKIMGCHSTKSEANAQLAALHISEKSQSAEWNGAFSPKVK